MNSSESSAYSPEQYSSMFDALSYVCRLQSDSGIPLSCKNLTTHQQGFRHHDYELEWTAKKLNLIRSLYIQDGPKNWHIFLYVLTTTHSYALTSSNIGRFSNLFHYLNRENICNNTVTTPQVCRYTVLWNVTVLKSNSWKQDDFCNNTF